MTAFTPSCRPLLIGSLPLADHREAIEMIFTATPEIPLWPQLPMYHEEGMVRQFLSGLPGVRECDGKTYIDSDSDLFGEETLAFYEEYLAIAEGEGKLEGSRFVIDEAAGRGFLAFLAAVAAGKNRPLALKGQTTGPFTFCTSLIDQHGRAIFYNEQLRDIAVKHLALKARWQIWRMKQLCDRAIMFFDEPALAGLGSSAFISISQEDICGCLQEVFAGVRAEGGLAGVHVCANTEWPTIFASGLDIISYDAYGFFDKLILYPGHLKEFLDGGGVLASGIVPTSPDLIDGESTESLTERWFQQSAQLIALGIEERTVYAQTLITPSCGTGAVSRGQAERVLALTAAVSAEIRRRLER
jgi:hypothetical protein